MCRRPEISPSSHTHWQFVEHMFDNRGCGVRLGCAVADAASPAGARPRTTSAGAVSGTPGPQADRGVGKLGVATGLAARMAPRHRRLELSHSLPSRPRGYRPVRRVRPDPDSARGPRGRGGLVAAAALADRDQPAAGTPDPRETPHPPPATSTAFRCRDGEDGGRDLLSSAGLAAAAQSQLSATPRRCRAAESRRHARPARRVGSGRA
jgi:hypothetical protein